MAQGSRQSVFRLSEQASAQRVLASGYARAMNLSPYLSQAKHWPRSGKHILAQYDEESICVYQAYRPAIASFAVRHQRFGGDFSFSRMSWIKPNFLWMMYRCGWASKPDQERVLAIRVPRRFFDELLRLAVPSGFDAGRYKSREAWQEAVAGSDVRLQWDPDHDPSGMAVERRAVQLGVRGDALRRYGNEEIVSIEDITSFVAEQRAHAQPPFADLTTPTEAVYSPESAAGAGVGLDAWPPETSP